MSLPITYKYEAYRNGVYLGVLPKVTSPFTFTQDINTGGSQLVITTAQDIDTQQQPVTTLTDESGDQLTDESGNPLTTDRAPDIYGNLNQGAMIRNGNEIKVWEYTQWQPNGKLVFDGVIKRWNAHIGTSDSVDLTVLSYGVELDNNILYGATTADQAVTTPSIDATIFDFPVSGTTDRVAQTFTCGAVTNISGILCELLVLSYPGGPSSVSLTVSLYTYSGSGNPDAGTLVGSKTTTLATNGSDAGATPYPLVSITFSSPLTIVPGQQYALVFTSGSPADAISLNPSQVSYTGGTGWVYSGGSWTKQSASTVFMTLAANSEGLFTNSVFFSEDPSAMVNTFMTNYIGAGGHVGIGNIASSSAIATYPFVLNTILEGLNACLSLAPSGYYWYVDVGTNLLYFQPKSATPDHIFTFKVHIQQFELLVTSETTITQAYLTAGSAANGQPILAYAADVASATNFGTVLDRLTDSRIIDAASAQAVINNYVETNSGEQYQSTINIFASNYDLTTLSLGQVVGFNGFESYADTIQMQIVRITRYPDYVTLDLGTIPRRASTKAQKIERSLLATQTVNNPLSAI